jgi:hypothetical protein
MTGLLLSLAVYAALCAAIARVYMRTGHSISWAVVSFVPLMAVVVAYVLHWVRLAEWSQGILSVVVLFYLAILLILSFKSWPIERAGLVETAK